MKLFGTYKRTGWGTLPKRRKSIWSLSAVGVLAIAGMITFNSVQQTTLTSAGVQPVAKPSTDWVQKLLNLANWHDRSFEGIFQATIPLMDTNDNLHGVNFTKGIQLVMQLTSDAKVGEPTSFLAAQIPLMKPTLQSMSPSEQQSPEENPVLPEDKNQELTETNTPPHKLTSEPLVAIYNTHTGETYAKTDGLDRLAGKRGGVYQAASAMAKTLEEKYGIKVVQSDKIHDDNFLLDNPYSKSFQTATSLIQENPSVQVVIDVHRDAGVTRDNSVVEINGQRMAKIMLVVGTNARQNHPNWQKNYAFAQALGKAIDQKYPGLLRKIMTKPGRYNQHLHPHAILVEIGSTNNSTQEAINSARLLAEVIAETVEEN